MMLLRRFEFLIADFRFPICGSATASLCERPTPSEFNKSAIGNLKSAMSHFESEISDLKSPPEVVS